MHQVFGDVGMGRLRVEVLWRPRAQERPGRPAPLLLLPARITDADRLRGLRGGADDYLTKPFNPDELAARAGAILRRASGSIPDGNSTDLSYPGLTIDLDRGRVLTGRLMYHDELLTCVW
jgi:DNA-binding response OmpR family regulator